MKRNQREHNGYRRLNCGVAALFLLLFIPVSLVAGEPTEQLKVTLDRVLMLLRDPRPESGQAARRGQLRTLIGSRFDFPEMARRSLGPHWKTLTGDEQRVFVEAFTGFLEGSYAAVFESYNGETISYRREEQDKNYARVDTRIAGKKGDETAIDYQLRLLDGEWKVYDVVVENVSMVNNYRSQFNRVIAESSFGELIRKMKEKQSRISTRHSEPPRHAALSRKNVLNESRPLILAGFVGAFGDKQLYPLPAR